MDIFRQGMRGPARPAPAVPGFNVNRYSPVTNWNDDPFGADVFEPMPQCTQKKKPPPRPPPPKINKQPDVPVKPSHFIRKPTVLSSLLSKRNKDAAPKQSVKPSVKSLELNSDVDPNRMFPKCEPKIVQTGALIDLSSPPSSPTFTTRSSSDGLSVDSFGSDATSSTNHNNALNGGSTSQAESGFEDDFELFMNVKKPMHRDNTFDDFTATDPFSPPSVSNKPPISKKPVIKDIFEVAGGRSQPVVSLSGPTIIRAKPARPKPPDNAALLRSTFGSSMPIPVMNLNTTTPIQKMNNGFEESFEPSKPYSWDIPEAFSEIEPPSPPMPSIPPPPPPPIEDEELPSTWPLDDIVDSANDAYVIANNDDYVTASNVEEPYAIALFDYATGHADDLSFLTNDRINLIRRENDEWLFGSLHNGRQGLFPANYVDIKVPLPDENSTSMASIAVAVALYDFEPQQEGDLRFKCGDYISVTHKLNDEWYYGECNGEKGQFPVNYVQMNS